MYKINKILKTISVSSVKVSVALVAILLLTTIRSSASELYVGLGSLYRFYNGDGKIGWTGYVYDDGTVKMDYVPFDTRNSIDFTPVLDFTATGFDGLGWSSGSNLTGGFLVGVRFSDYISLQGTLQLATTISSVHSESGWTGAANFSHTVTTQYKHSTLSLEFKLFPLANSLYLLGGLERTRGELAMGGQQVTDFNNTIATYTHALGDAKIHITPKVGAGVESFFGRNFGMFAQATYSSSKYTNLKDGKATIDIYPNMEFDTGGLGISMGVLMKLRSNWR